MAETRTFFLLVFGLSLPFWLLGALTGRLELPVDLPLGALQAVVPGVAASLLVFRQSGQRGVRALLARSIDVRKVPLRWFAPILLLWPAIMSVSYLLMSLLGEPLPDRIEIPWLALPVFLIVFLVSATGEQLGWQAFAFDRLYPRRSVLTASAIIGAVWALWHVVPFIQIPRPPDWILWQCLSMIPFRVLIGWIYLGTARSVFATIAFHATANVSQFSFPNYGSAYDPFYTFLLLSIAAAAATVWGINPGRGPSRWLRTPSARPGPLARG